MTIRSGLMALPAMGLIALAACGGNTSTQGAAGKLPAAIKIGAPFDLSGSAAIAGVGTAELEGVRLAVDEINSSKFLPGSKIDLTAVDTRADKAQAVSQTIDLIQRQKVDAVVGYSLTPSFLAAGPNAQDAKVPVVTVGLSAAGVTDVGDYIFRIYPPLTQLFDSGDKSFVSAYSPKTAAYLYDSDTVTTVGQAQFRKDRLEKMGIKTVATQTALSSATDVRAQLTQIKNANPDVLVVDVDSGQWSLVLNQYRDLGLSTQIFGDLGLQNKTVLQNAGKVAQCAVFSSTWDISSKAGKNPHFIQLFRSKHGGQDPDNFNAWGYDAMWLMATAVKNVGSVDHAKVRDELVRLRDFQGALGVYQFDQNRIPTQKGVLLQVQDGKPTVWTPATHCSK